MAKFRLTERTKQERKVREVTSEDYNAPLVRVGVAFTHPAGPTQLRRQYGIFRYRNHNDLYVQFEGTRYLDERGHLVMTGLRLGGPGWRPEPLMDFNRSWFGDVHMFGDPGFKSRRLVFEKPPHWTQPAAASKQTPKAGRLVRATATKARVNDTWGLLPRVERPIRRK